jgi:Zn-dependent peptidase ImmA (M78 family)
MVLRRGFKTEANKYAREFRQDLGLEVHSPLCPWRLAKHLAIEVYALSSFSNDEPQAVYQLMHIDQKSFSAATVFSGLKRLIVFNDAHPEGRQASNIIHELAHAILGHPPTIPFNEYGCRNFDKEIEEEAEWLGPALLVSEEAALHIARQRMTEQMAAEYYRCTVSVVRFRLNMTGASRRISR